MQDSNATSDYLPHAYLYGYSGTDLVGEADILQPISQDNKSNLFLYAQGSYGSERELSGLIMQNPWFANFGIGYRDIFSKLGLVGGYIFADYNGTSIGKQVWTLGPGVERLGKYWEFRANGYFPVGTHSWTQTYWADEVGDYSYRHATGYEMYDAKFIFHEEAAAGGDAEIGARLFKLGGVITKIYANGYYFDMHKHQDVLGGGGRLTFQKTRAVKFSVNDSYDNYQHNRFVLGVELSLYDLIGSDRNKPIDEDDLQPRLNDPIERDFAATGGGSSALVGGAPGTPSEGDHDVIIPPEPETVNDYYFDANKTTIGNGTAEDPYNNKQYIQDTINFINTNSAEKGFAQANLYFKGFDNRTYTDKGTTVNLYSGQWLFGLDTNYQAPATGLNRPIIEGQLKLAGNNHIDSFIFHNVQQGPKYNAGIVMDNAQHIVLNNVEIGSGMLPDNAKPRTDADPTINSAVAYNTGLIMANNSQIDLIKDSNIFGYAPNATKAGVNGDEGIGLDMENGGTITRIEGSKFSGVGGDGYDDDSDNGTNAGSGYGIKANGGTIVIGQNGIESSQFLGNGGGGGYGGNSGTGSYKHGIIGGGGAFDTSFNGGNGGAGSGLFANGVSLEIGSIKNSQFYGNVNASNVESIGSSSSANSGGIFGGSGGNTTGNATTGTGGSGGDGFGLEIKGTSEVHIVSINSSQFYGNTNIGKVENIGGNGINTGGIFGGGAYLSKGVGGAGYGLDAEGNNVVKIGYIKDSLFYGNANVGDVTKSIGSGSSGSNAGGIFGGGGEYDYFGGGTGGAGFGLEAKGTNVSIGNINYSQFYGNANVGAVGSIGSSGSLSNDGGIFGGGGSSLGAAGGVGYGLDAKGNSVEITGQIISSKFYGNANVGNVGSIGGSSNNGGTFGDMGQSGGGNGGNGYGLSLNATAGNVTVGGAVSGNTFGANTDNQTGRKTNNGGSATKGIGTDFYASGTNVAIASITGNTFITTNTNVIGSPDASIDHYLNFVGNVNVAGYTTLSSLKTYLGSPNNTFTPYGNPSNLGLNGSYLSMP
jgi:hypothetical protein